jgi:hypothetical protein
MQPSISLTDDERGQLAMSVMNVLREWEVDPEVQLTLLGLEQRMGRELARYKRGTPLPDELSVIERAQHIMGIQQALLTIFPLNHRMASFWLRMRNRNLRSVPLDLMLSDGLIGMDRVWRILDCTRNWD